MGIFVHWKNIFVHQKFVTKPMHIFSRHTHVVDLLGFIDVFNEQLEKKLLKLVGYLGRRQ